MIENKSPWAFALLLGGRNEYFSCSFFGRDYFQMRHKAKHNTRHNRTGIFHKSAYQESTRLLPQRWQGNRLHRMIDCLTGVSRLFR